MKFDARAIANSTIPQASNVKRILFPDGNTDDIIAVIVYADKRSAGYTRDFAPTLKGPTVKDTCWNLWKFVKENVGYHEDGFTHQDIKSPAQLWKDMRGDCKSFSIFIASCLQNLRIPYKFRFVSFSPLSRRVTHVYVVVPDGNSEIIIDAVWHSFNSQKPFYYKRDIMGTTISYVSGIGGKVINNRYKEGMLKLPPAAQLHKMTDLEMDLYLAKQNAEIKRNNLRKIAGIGTLQEENYTAKIEGINDLIAAVTANDRAGDPEMISLIADDIDRGAYNMVDQLAGIGDINDRSVVRSKLLAQMRQRRVNKHSDKYHRQAMLYRRKAGAAKLPAEKAVWMKRYTSAMSLADRVHGINMEDAHIGSFFGKVFKGVAKGLKGAAKAVGKGAKAVGKGVKAVAKTALKVATLPARLVIKGILELTLPKAAPNFLYLFINNQSLINQLPEAARRKRKKAEKTANFIVNAIGMKRAHFMGIVRNGIEKRYGMSPEKYLEKILKRKISGVGAFPVALIGTLLDIIKKIASLFGKKPAPDEVMTEQDIPDPEKDFAGMSESQQSDFGSQVSNQPVPTFTAASYSSGGDSGGGGGSYFAESGSGGGASEDSGAAQAASSTQGSQAVEQETGPDPAQVSQGWC